MTTPIWPCIIYRDAPAAIEFLTKAFGFDATLVGNIRSRRVCGYP